MSTYDLLPESSRHTSGSSLTLPAQARADGQTGSLLAARISAYAELVRPRIAMLVLLTVTLGYVIAGQGPYDLARLGWTLAGVGLAAAASGALNQLLECETDRRMLRTAGRPLPTGALAPIEVGLFGTAAGLCGVLVLAAMVNSTTALLTLLTIALYVGGYTPLKRHTALCTAIGAIPGAMPPVLGWCAAGRDLDGGAFALFGIMFLWQFPHFLAIAWLYRHEYAEAGLRMLPGRVPARRVTGLLACGYAATLIPVSVLPGRLELAGGSYRVAAILLSLTYLAAAIRFFWNETRGTARGLLFASLVYLPTLLAVLAWDHVRLS